MVKTLYREHSKSGTSHKDVAFTHFGVLDAGKQGGGSLLTALVINITIAVIVCILGVAAKKVATQARLTMLTEPVPIVKVEPKPKPIVKPLPKPPEIKVTPPKINVPEVKVPDLPKPPEIKMQPTPVVLQPAPPKIVQPPPAPVKVNLPQAQAASVVNNSPTPAAVRLGSATNPINNTTGPAVSKINLGQSGMAGMPASNTGLGPASTKVNLGSGSPNGTIGGRDNAAQPIQGVKLGVAGGTGPLNSKGAVAGPVNLGQVQQPALARPAAIANTAANTPPKVLFKPKPEYTDEARKLHLEGTVQVRVRVEASGIVQVLGISSGLGHGLDEAARRVVEGMRFSPAMQDGHPVDWTGVVSVGFQMVG